MKKPIGIVRSYEVRDVTCRTLIRSLPVRLLLPGLWIPIGDLNYNDFMKEGSSAVAQLLAGSNQYRLRGMYIEFDNAGGTISPPTYSREEGRSYYDSLSGHPTRDYLRVSLDSVVTAISDEAFPVGNQVQAFAQTTGTVGVHGKAFSAGAGSVVFGGALVAMPDDGDYTQDLIVDRFYYSAGKQRTKGDSAVGLQWEMTFN